MNPVDQLSKAVLTLPYAGELSERIAALVGECRARLSRTISGVLDAQEAAREAVPAERGVFETVEAAVVRSGRSSRSWEGADGALRARWVDFGFRFFPGLKCEKTFGERPCRWLRDIGEFGIAYGPKVALTKGLDGKMGRMERPEVFAELVTARKVMFQKLGWSQLDGAFEHVSDFSDADADRYADLCERLLSDIGIALEEAVLRYDQEALLASPPVTPFADAA